MLVLCLLSTLSLIPVISIIAAMSQAARLMFEKQSSLMHFLRRAVLVPVAIRRLSTVSLVQIRVQDNVKAQHKLVTEKFGIKKLVMVIGWSMGAGQSFQWAVR